MSLSIINKNAPANGGYWRYTQPESGQQFSSPYYDQLIAAVLKHRKIMNYPISSQFEEEMDHALCSNHPSSCHEPAPFQSPNFMDQAVSFATTFAVWIREGLPVVSREVYIQRRNICAGTLTTTRCDYWGGDTQLGFGRCRKCGCSGLKLFMATVQCPLTPPKW